MQIVAAEFRCDDCSHICITSIHHNRCCICREEKNICKMCHAYQSNIAIYFAKEYPTGDKEIDFIYKNKLNIVYNYEYLQRLEKLAMEISPESAFDIIKDIDKMEDHIKDDNAPLLQLRENLCFVLQVDEDEIAGLSFKEYVSLKMEEMI